jgi:hypothetical protein
MVALAGVLSGALIGWLLAWNKGLNRLDQAHYAGVGAIALGAIAILMLVILARLN